MSKIKEGNKNKYFRMPLHNELKGINFGLNSTLIKVGEINLFESIFPKAFGGRGHPLDDGTTNCNDRPDALKVKPVQGDVIIFYSLYADGSVDEHSLHAACPVGANQIKYAANKWIWTQDK
jgi:hypothetical protein